MNTSVSSIINVKKQSMKKGVIIMGMCGLFLMTSAVFAQDQGKNVKCAEMTSAQKSEKYMERMTKELNLTPSQAEKIQAINAKHMSENAKTREEMMALREKMKLERAATKVEIRAVLTAEQQEVMNAKNAEREAKRKEHYKKKCQK